MQVNDISTHHVFPNFKIRHQKFHKNQNKYFYQNDKVVVLEKFMGNKRLYLLVDTILSFRRSQVFLMELYNLNFFVLEDKNLISKTFALKKIEPVIWTELEKNYICWYLLIT